MMDDDYSDAATAADDHDDDHDDDNGDNNDNDMISKRKIVAKLTNSFFDVFQYSGIFLRLIMDIWKKETKNTHLLWRQMSRDPR